MVEQHHQEEVQEAIGTQLVAAVDMQQAEMEHKTCLNVTQMQEDLVEMEEGLRTTLAGPNFTRMDVPDETGGKIIAFLGD